MGCLMKLARHRQTKIKWIVTQLVKNLSGTSPQQASEETP